MDTSKIGQLLSNSGFLPSKEDLDLIKGWIMFNIEDILTLHLPELAQFRAHVR